MNVQAEKLQLIEWLVQLQDVNLLRRVKELMQHDQENASETDIIGYRAGGEAITVADLKAKITSAEEQIDRGEYLTVEQLRKESEQWLKESTK